MDINALTLVIPILGILASVILPIAIVWLLLRSRAERSRLIYETAVRLAEKGQPVPPELFANANPTASDLRRGLVLVAVGSAICIALYEIGVPWTFGLIPAFAGIGYLLVWTLEGRKQPRSSVEAR
jgi:hypothetical protein